MAASAPWSPPAQCRGVGGGRAAGFCLAGAGCDEGERDGGGRVWSGMRRASQTRRTVRACRSIGPAFTPEVHAGGPGVVWWRRYLPLRLEALLPRLGFDQRAVDREMLGGQQWCALAGVSTCSKNAVATSPANKRSRFFMKTGTAPTEAPRSRPTHQRNSRLYCSASGKSRSLRRRSSTGNNCHYMKAPKIVKWQYCDPSRRIGAQSTGTGQWCLQQYTCIKKQDPWGV